MIFTPHMCERMDCKHNNNGDCSFFVGDLYYMDCIQRGTMYEKKEE